MRNLIQACAGFGLGRDPNLLRLARCALQSATWKPFYLLSMLTAGFVLFTQLHAEGYISRRYTVRQIVGESTNIVFGTVTEVNTKRQTAKVKVEENLKGTSEFKEIKIRIDVGQEDHPRKLMRLIKRGEPIIVFYLTQGARIDSLGHIRGKWFQTQAQDRGDRNRVWWMFTHIEIHLNEDKVSRRDSTPDFQRELRGMLGTDAIQLLFFKTETYEAEPPVISRIDSVVERWIAYHETKNRDLPGLRAADILWIGFRSLSEGRYRLNKSQENQIKEFVRAGGVVIASGQDSDADRPCATGWLPEPLHGVESPFRNDFKPTSHAGELFKAPHRIRSGQLALDDSWDGWNEKYEVLATTNGGKEIVVAKLKYGKGMYLITSLHNRNNSHVSKNRRMLENLVHFAVEFLDESN